MNEPALTISRLTHRFKDKTAVDNLSLEVPRGSIFGFLGPNGAGKTTTIRALLNLIQPTSGRLCVLGLDTEGESQEVRKRIGYVAESPDLYGWMTVEETLRFTRAFYRHWDCDLENSLVGRFQLPRLARVRTLSRGMRAKLALTLALAPRPELLILDEPTSGLDAVVRREFLEEVIANVQAEGGTVFLSSHLLNEVERVVDDVVILQEGRVALRGSLEGLKSGFKQLRAIYSDAVPEDIRLPDLVRLERGHHEALLTVSSFSSNHVHVLHRQGADSVQIIDLALEEIFCEVVRGGQTHV